MKPGEPFYAWTTGSRLYVCSTHAAANKDARVNSEPVLCIQALDGRIFQLKEEVHFDGVMSNSDAAVAARGLDRLTPDERAAVERLHLAYDASK